MEKYYKILFFHPKNDFTGSTRVLATILSDKYKNVEVSVVTHYYSREGLLSKLGNVKIYNTWIPFFRGKPVKVLSYVIWFIYSFSLSLIVGYRYNCFYINTIIPFYAALAGRIMHKEIVYHIHEIYFEDSLIHRIPKIVFNTTLSHRIFVSKYISEQYRNDLSCSSEVIYNKLGKTFLENVRYRPVNRRSLNTITMIASLSIKKGIDTFIKIGKLMPSKKFILVLSALQSEIDCFIREIPYNIEILPMQPNIQSIYEKTDLILNLTNPQLCIESFGMTILEAMPYGIPAIVPNVGGPTELVKDGYNGYCVDVRDCDKVITAIEKALTSSNYKLLSNHAINRYNTYFK